MSGPSALGFAGGRAGVSWLVLIAATLVSFTLGEHGVGSVTVVVVLGIAAIKIRLIGLDFVELRSAPIPLRAAFEGYCLAMWAVLSGVYLFL